MASAPDKIWPRENFLALAAHLEANLGLEPVFVAAANEDLSAFSAYPCLQGAPLEELKSLLAGAALFVGNDSGPAHIAAAFGLPVIVLFGSSEVENWRPWPREGTVLTSPHGIGSIGVPEVLEAIASAPPTTPMTELRRLLRYVRPYFAPLLLSVILMALVGAAQGFTAILIGPVFDRVLNPDSPDSPVALFTIPLFQHNVYLQDLLPAAIHNVWTMVVDRDRRHVLHQGRVRLLRELLHQLCRRLGCHRSAPDGLR